MVDLEMTTLGKRIVLIVSVTITVGNGCRGEVAHDLEETEANRVVAALADQGIAAETIAEGRQGDRSWVVSVPSTEVARARLVLRERELPTQTEQGLAEVFDRSGLLPTPIEEQALLIRAVQGELVETIESVDGVLSARVHLSVSDGRRSLIPFDEERPRSSASVLIRHSGDNPPLTEAHIKSLVSGAVMGLDSERVNVVMVARRQPARSGRCQLVAFGPLSLSPGSVMSLKVGIGIVAVLIGLLGLGLVIMALKIRSLRRHQ